MKQENKELYVSISAETAQDIIRKSIEKAKEELHKSDNKIFLITKEKMEKASEKAKKNKKF